MTRIYFIINPDLMFMYIADDPRSMRELIKGINTGVIRIGEDEVRLEGAPQSAKAHLPLHVITVILGYPEVYLSARLYDVLYGIADGKSAGQIAADLGIGRRTIYEYTALLKQRFGVKTKEEMMVQAIEAGIPVNDYP